MRDRHAETSLFFREVAQKHHRSIRHGELARTLLEAEIEQRKALEIRQRAQSLQREIAELRRTYARGHVQEGPDS